jgi:hypothetical protein
VGNYDEGEFRGKKSEKDDDKGECGGAYGAY